MAKQPYIPFYVGDYLKDTRMLPISVRGFWVDVILFMWDNPIRGEIIGTLEEVSRMVGCTEDEARFALNLLKQKGTAEIILLDSGEWHIVSRRMKRDAEISKKRSKAGKNGVKAKFAQANAEAKPQAKVKQNTEYDNEVDNDIEINIKEAFDEIYLEQESMKWPHLDFKFEFNSFLNKIRGAPKEYFNRDSGSLRLAFQYQLRNSKGKKNGTTKKQSPADLAASFAERVMQDARGGKVQGN